ncbi:MAG: ATP-dependent Clp protease ATP-binding subunit [Candidatus Peregrinibacteria bacterium]|nr:ATP-dependent Clp protease ATP-binding subunit [Candidatus Peregrinibacteria bacterium]
MSDFSRFEKFTKEAKQALVYAQDRAKEARLNYVGTEHILLGILSQTNSLGSSILLSFGVSLENVHLVLKTVGRTGQQQTSDKGPTGLSGFAKKVIEDAVHCAAEFSHAMVGTEHLLYALVSQENTAATVILENMKVNPQDVKDQVIEAFERSRMQNGGSPMGQNNQMMNPIEFFLNGLQGVMTQNQDGGKAGAQFGRNDAAATAGAASSKKSQKGNQKQSKTPALDYFTTDLVLEARKGKLSPVIGRTKEIQRVISILCRKTKNNPALLGEPGVGKTAIAEGLAQAIVREQVPDCLLDKRLLSLSMTSLVAGTKYRGEFEERIKQVLDEASSQTNVILFIDELHTVIGAGSAEGSLDAANILKPALSRGQVQVIGATTTAEYRKHIETDTALERRFQVVMVNEPNIEDTLEMLKGLKEGFEEHHSLIIEDAAVEAAVRLSKRYVHDRFLPDKAIDLIDEASSLKRISAKGNIDTIRKLQQELNETIKAKEEAVSNQNYEHAAELRNKELEVMRAIDEAKTLKIPREKRERVTEEDVARVVATMTGVPVMRLIKEDADNLLKLEETLHNTIIGQDEAVISVAKAIRRSRTGISDPNRPIASFIFLGPTGVGKTELVKTLAKQVFNDKDALIKIDMSEFMERHNTSRLVGTTAGYVGYEDGGQLTEQVRRKPYAVILFDEIEKAHSEVFNLLLQILEDGVLTDGKGRKVDFKNTIIVMTSNIGADKLTEKAAPFGFNLRGGELEQAMSNFEAMEEDVQKELKMKFRPEFLNRIDKIVMFKPLVHEDVKKIVELNLRQLQERLKLKNITLEPDQSGLDVISKKGYDPQYGARPVRRAIQTLVEDLLTQGFLDGTFSEGDTIAITADPSDENKVVLTKVAHIDATAPRKTKSVAKTTKKVKVDEVAKE